MVIYRLNTGIYLIIIGLETTQSVLHYGRFELIIMWWKKEHMSLRFVSIRFGWAPSFTPFHPISLHPPCPVAEYKTFQVCDSLPLSYTIGGPNSIGPDGGDAYPVALSMDCTSYLDNNCSVE